MIVGLRQIANFENILAYQQVMQLFLLNDSEIVSIVIPIR